ncbi:hypothetical protein NA56DRAFT_726398 [Hyaloscypha hepaticicola]|uniref:Uncharacterized protein n=1 Tax=Hyaloscypha hepaticicola TaxID=2082293 RepID=A0A2J6QMC4_9HELO|nr:hypothetical protein NA56DRAFT_726398 [Hyaloscypha hepaticicola]
MGGPNNTLHNFADMMCRGFSKSARRDFRKNQRREKKERERWRARHNSDKGYESETSSDLYIYPGSTSMLNIVPLGFPVRSPGSMLRRVSAPLVTSEPGWPLPPSYPSIPPIEELQPPPGVPLRHPTPPHLPQEPTRIGWDPETSNDRVRPSKSRHTQNPGLVPIYEPTAIPMTETRGSERLPTYQAPLVVNERTILEGLRPRTAYDTGRHRRRR